VFSSKLFLPLVVQARCIIAAEKENDSAGILQKPDEHGMVAMGWEGLTIQR
jgi:hypothetical protein